MGQLIQYFISVAGATLLLLPVPTFAQAPCFGLVGDCDGDGAVTIAELVSAVRISLGTSDISSCPAVDSQADGRVSVGELIRAVVDALEGCECADCDDGNVCTRDVCSSDDRCGHSPIRCPEDDNECTNEGCNAETGCGSIAVVDGTSCDRGEGACEAGKCVTLRTTPTPTPTPQPGVDLVPRSASSRQPPCGCCITDDTVLPEGLTTVCIENTGTDPASSFNVSYRDGGQQEQFRIDSIESGKIECVEGPIVGANIEVIADVDNEVDENDESNNTAMYYVATPTVTLPPECTPTMGMTVTPTALGST